MSENQNRATDPQNRNQGNTRGGPMRGPMGGGHGMMPGAKPKNFKRTVLMLWGYLKRHRPVILAAFLLTICSTMFSIAGPKLLGRATSKLVEAVTAYMGGAEMTVDFAYIGRIILMLAVLYVFSALCLYVQGYAMAKVSQDVSYSMRKGMSEKIHRLPPGYYDTHARGDILSRITNDIDTVSQTLNQSLTQIISSVVTIAGVLIMMFSISWIMALSALLIIPVIVGLVGVIIKNSQKYFKDQQKYIGELNAHVEEMYSGHNIVEAFNGEADAVEKFEKTNVKLRSSAWKSQFISSAMHPVMNLAGNLGYVAVSILGGYLAVRRVVDIGDIQAFIQYMRQFTQPVGQLAMISNTLQSTAAAAERVFEFMEEPEEAAEEAQRGPLTVNGNVRFEHVSFGYSASQVIIKDFSANIKSGQKVAIVGPTGAGKTTIVKLLMRFYDINSGKIEIDGVDISGMPKDKLRSCFGMVLQDTWLYNATIMENIRYGSFGATDEQVIAAAKAAHCDEFIRSLPGGYQMVLGEDAANISQGQKQLFTIARVILSDPKILILDEATSSVDTRTEILIQNAMDELVKNRTSFVIAHRLSTVKNADVILVLRDGDIVEQGSHSELLRRGGFYADLYNSQFELEEEREVSGFMQKPHGAGAF